MWMAAIVSAALDTLVLAPPLWLWVPRVPCPWACGSRCCSTVAPCCLAPRWWLQQPCGHCHFPPRAPGALFLPWVPSPCRCAPGAPSAPASAVPPAASDCHGGRPGWPVAAAALCGRTSRSGVLFLRWDRLLNAVWHGSVVAVRHCGWLRHGCCLARPGGGGGIVSSFHA